MKLEPFDDMKQTLHQAEYKYIKYLGNRDHLLLNEACNALEVFSPQKFHSGWGLIYKNTHLEFQYSISNTDKHTKELYKLYKSHLKKV